LQLVHDPRARLHHPVPVPQQLPHIAILPARHPDLRKAIFHHQSQNQLRILAIPLLLAYSLRTDLSCVPDPQLELHFRQQPFKPARMPTGFHSHTHLHSLCRQITVELLRFLAVLQSPLPAVAGGGVHKSNLLEGRVIIASYDQHISSFLPSLWLVSTTKAYSGLRSRHCHGINYAQNPSMSDMA
jgi:hypothetical protein